jgi:hypothetical protein
MTDFEKQKKNNRNASPTNHSNYYGKNCFAAFITIIKVFKKILAFIIDKNLHKNSQP